MRIKLLFIAVLVLLCSSPCLRSNVNKAIANPVPYPLIRMPEEYIYANITMSDENAYARVNTTYPFTENDFGTVSMSYPLPINSTDVNVRVDSNETYWWYTNQTYETVYGNIPVINWTISPAPNKFVVNVNYDHEVPKVGENFTYFYAMGTWKSLEGIYNKQVTAYVTVDVNNMNVSDTETLEISVYQIGRNSTTGQWVWKLLKYGVSKNNETFRISVTVQSDSFAPITGDFLLTFKKVEMQTIKVPEDYLKIQTAIDAANYKDTIQVANGTYYENIDVWKPLHVIGGENTVIDGSEIGTVVQITANNVEFCHFTIQNSGNELYPISAGLKIIGGGCNVTGNRIKNSLNGIVLYTEYSSPEGCILRNNSMTENKYNFGVEGFFNEKYFKQDIDTSNIIDGKPIYYWVNQHDKEIPGEAGYVAVINSTNITVKNLRLTNNEQGVLFICTNNSIIQNAELLDNFCNIFLGSSNNNTIADNTISSVSTRNPFCGDECGIKIWKSKHNVINFNRITMVDEIGLLLAGGSNENVVNGNTISNSRFGIHSQSVNNFIYRNNFVNNSQHAWCYKSRDSWDYHGEGNYWSGYTGVDSNYDGIGDTVHILDANNTDNYPLMGMFSDFNTTSEYHVYTICNSSITSFQYNGTALSFNVSGEDGTAGFCRICIPAALMNDTFRVLVNGTEIPCSLLPCSNSTHSYLYFNYTHSTKEVIIITEFPSFLILPLFMIATLLAVIVYRRKPFAISRRYFHTDL